MAKRPRRSSLGGVPEPNGAATIRSRHQAVQLVNEHPELWPLLNQLTVFPPIDWPYVLRKLFNQRVKDANDKATTHDRPVLLQEVRPHATRRNVA